MLPLVKLQASACNFTTTLLKVILLYDCFTNVLSCTNDTKSLMVSQIQFSKQSSFSFVHLCRILCGMRLLHIIYYFWTNTFYWMVQVTVLHLPTLIVFIRSTLDFFSLNENKKLNNLFAKYDIFLHFSFSLSLQPRVNDPLFNYHFRILE